jgi:hypothetical protein
MVKKSNMVQINNKWNISDKQGGEIAHRFIINILKGSPHNTIPLSKLVKILNQHTKHIKFINHKKRKTISLYITCKYGSITHFLDTFTIYGLIHINNIMHVKLIDTEIIHNKTIDPTILNEYKEWIFINNTDDYIIV